MSAEPSGTHDDPRRRAGLAGISPTIRSISDSNVTRPGRAAVFVDDQRLARPPPPHLGEQIVGAKCFGHRQHFARERAGVDVAVAAGERAQQVGHVQHADDVVEVVAVDRQARVTARARSRDQLAERRLGGDGDELGARNHHLTRGQIREPEHAVEHLFFLLLEHAGFLARGHQHLQLFFRVHHRAPIGAVQPEHLDDRLRRCRAPARMNGQNSRMKISSGCDHHSAVASDRSQGDPFRRQLAEARSGGP